MAELMFIDFYIARPTYCFILAYTCGLTVVIKRICYVMLWSTWCSYALLAVRHCLLLGSLARLWNAAHSCWLFCTLSVVRQMWLLLTYFTDISYHFKPIFSRYMNDLSVSAVLSIIIWVYMCIFFCWHSVTCFRCWVRSQSTMSLWLREGEG